MLYTGVLPSSIGTGHLDHYVYFLCYFATPKATQATRASEHKKAAQSRRCPPSYFSDHYFIVAFVRPTSGTFYQRKVLAQPQKLRGITLLSLGVERAAVSCHQCFCQWQNFILSGFLGRSLLKHA
jgi:hypothetical protein